jgi:ElaB/YqjD/DUF883 family membrane-anchored ribosome-binding protein
MYYSLSRRWDKRETLVSVVKLLSTSAAASRAKKNSRHGIPVASSLGKKWLERFMENSFEETLEGFRSRLDDQMKHVKDRVAGIVESVKESWSEDRRRHLSEAAERTRLQAEEYLRTSGARHMLADTADLIRRYPIAALAAGALIGLLWSRRKGG